MRPTEAPKMNWDHALRSSRSRHFALPQQHPIRKAASARPDWRAHRALRIYSWLVSASFFLPSVHLRANEDKRRNRKRKEDRLADLTITKWPRPVAPLPLANGHCSDTALAKSFFFLFRADILSAKLTEAFFVTLRWFLAEILGKCPEYKT